MSTDPANDSTLLAVHGDEHDRLAALAGDWRGISRVFLDPSKPPLEDGFRARAAMVVGKRFLRIAYDTALGGKPATGELLVAFERDEGRWAASWVDTFHTGSAILFSHGVPSHDRGPVSVFGTYFVKGVPERWGWRTELDDGAGGLVIRMFNVSPDRHEDLGVEVVLSRASKARKAKAKAGRGGRAKRKRARRRR